MTQSANWLDLLGTEFDVKVTPKASSNRVKLEVNEVGVYYIRAYVTVVPEKGKANQAVIKLLSKQLKIPKSYLKLLRGESNPNKRFKVVC
jgi:uncharacterized protein YggU (UPF0235/DUF167 family)